MFDDQEKKYLGEQFLETQHYCFFHIYLHYKCENDSLLHMEHCHQGSPLRLQSQWSDTAATLVNQCLLLVVQAHNQMGGSFVNLEQEPMREELH